MKNLIFKYYNIIVDKIYKKNKNYFFYINDQKIYIYKYQGIEEKIYTLFKITNNLYYNGLLVNTFVLNNKNEFFTKHNDYYIILLKVNQSEINIELSDIKKFFNIDSSLENYDIIKEWTNEIDIIEKELLEYNKEYPIIQNSIDYYIGLAENAIELLYYYEPYIINNNDSIGHKNLFNSFKLDSLNNPFNFIKTNKMYDISNYLKYNILNKNIDFNETKNIIKGLNEFEEVFLFACLMYPNNYFDLVKKVMLKKESENKLEKYIKSIDNYINFLKYCKNNMNNNLIIKKINWIK